MTNNDPAFTRPDPEPTTPDLADVMGMVDRLGATSVMGRDGRRLALALSAVNVESLEGLVIDSEVYSITHRTEWATCRCGDGKHEERRDAPPGRAAWQRVRREADASLALAIARWKWGARTSPEPHLVTHVVAVTSTEVVR